MRASTRKRTGGETTGGTGDRGRHQGREVQRQFFKKKMQAATRVGNLSWSEGILIKGDEETRAIAIAMAKAVLVHQGYEEEEDRLKAASEDLGLACGELWQDKA